MNMTLLIMGICEEYEDPLPDVSWMQIYKSAV